MRNPFAIFLVTFLLLKTATAWSPTPTRRGFLKQAGGTVIATGASSIAIGTLPESALAFAGTLDKIYRPPPNSLTNQVMVITGSSSGLGLESAKRLAAAGATTVLTTRSDTKGIQAVAQVQSYLQEKSIDNPNVYFVTLDLENLHSIQAFPQQFQNKLGNQTRIDVLMNNAGVAAIPQKEITPDGFERTFQVNHLGPFLLTSLLCPLLNRNGARIINVSSTAHKFNFHPKGQPPGLDLNNLNSEVEYLGDGWQSYSQTKQENILWTQELQRRADQQGLTWLAVSSLHPGVVATDIWRTSWVRKDDRNLLQSWISRLGYSTMWTVAEGANTQVWLAAQLDPSIGRGTYYDETGRIPKLADFAMDRTAAQKLWERSEEWLGMQFSSR
jgi:NAD(P)-dependent dehydrogenase (short-subunit alcohol dehydrogenase family)